MSIELGSVKDAQPKWIPIIKTQEGVVVDTKSDSTSRFDYDWAAMGVSDPASLTREEQMKAIVFLGHESGTFVREEEAKIK